MLGKKRYSEKLFVSFQLSNRIPENNFYRKLKDRLDLNFLYELCEPYYRKDGRKSIDPTVFFKIMLIGHLENIASYRQLLEHISLRLDLLYFIDHNLEDSLPWHSTISRTKNKFPKEVFEELFDKVLSRCSSSGFVKSNAC